MTRQYRPIMALCLFCLIIVGGVMELLHLSVQVYARHLLEQGYQVEAGCQGGHCTLSGTSCCGSACASGPDCKCGKPVAPKPLLAGAYMEPIPCHRTRGAADGITPPHSVGYKFILHTTTPPDFHWPNPTRIDIAPPSERWADHKSAPIHPPPESRNA